MNKSAYPKVLVYAVIVTFCCGMVTGAPASSPVHSKLDMKLARIFPDYILSATLDMIVSKYKKVTEDAFHIIHGDTINNIGSTISGGQRAGSLLTHAIFSRKPEPRTCWSSHFNSQVNAILESARLQLAAVATKCDPLSEAVLEPIKLEVNAKLIDLLMNSDDIMEHVVEYLGFTEEKSKKEWTDFLTEFAPEIIEEINKSDIIHKNPVEARKLLEEHFASNLSPSFDT